MPLRKIGEWPRTKKRLDHRAYQGLVENAGNGNSDARKKHKEFMSWVKL
jgi:hypothetical protein